MEKIRLKRYDVIINLSKAPYSTIAYLYAKNERDAIYIMDNWLQIIDRYESYAFTEPKKSKRESYESKHHYYNLILQKLDENGIDVSKLK